MMRHRATALVPGVVAILAAIALYAPIVAGIARQWYEDSTSSHGVLLAAAAAIVLRRTWPRVTSLTPAPRDAGFAILALALVGYVLGSLGGDLFILRATLPIATLGVILALWGVGHVRALLAPLALAALAIPLPAVLVTHLTLPLQLVASHVAASALTAAHIQVVRDGNLLALPNITLEVAEACSGLRSVVSLLSVAAVCAAVIPLRPRRAALLIAAAIPIAVFGNGLRVAATGVMAVWFGEGAARGFVHELTGFVAFLAMCALTLGIEIVTRKSTGRAALSPSIDSPAVSL
jgi:exosortase